ncbi:helix-turn-helix domain-containing protein [Mycobacterium novum]
MSQRVGESHTWKTPPEDWAEEQALRIAQTVRTLRGKRSAQWLADRTEALGYTVTRSVISDLELGRRRYVSTAEIIVLAAALTVSPAYLLYPDLPDGLVELTPSTPVPSIDALMWFSGEKIHQPVPSRVDLESGKQHTGLAASAAAHVLDLSRKRIYLQERMKRLATIAKSLRPNQDVRTTAAEEISAIWDELEDIRGELEALNAVVVSDPLEDERLGG